MGLLTAIGNALGAVSNWFAFAAARMGYKNAPDVKKAAINADKQKVKDCEQKEIADEKTDAIRDRLADPDHNQP